MKNQLIIFSKNRACQLHLLLESIERNSNSLFDTVKVVYLFTNKDYENGYNKLIGVFKNVEFIIETNFYKNILHSIDSNLPYTTFMVDDNVLYNTIPNTQKEILDKITDDVCCFSLRLGVNCTYSHPANLHYNINQPEIDNDFVTVDFSKQRGDFGYPLSVDGHIFKTKLIKNILTNMGNFMNPNFLEGGLQRFLGNIPKKMIFFKTSYLVGIPANIVNETHPNRKGVVFPFSVEELNSKYIDNKLIDFSSMDFNGINGPHKEIKYIIK